MAHKPQKPKLAQKCQQDLFDTYKMLLIGNHAVGKTALAHFFMGAPFREDYRPTAGCHTYNFLHFGAERLNVLNVQLTDPGHTARLMYLPYMRENYVLKTNAFVFCFSITDVESFKAVQNYFNKIPEIWPHSELPVILVGLKSDLKHDRKVSYQEAKAKADFWGCDYVEISAKTGEHTDYFMNKIYFRMKKVRDESLPKKPEKVDSNLTVSTGAESQEAEAPPAKQKAVSKVLSK